MNQREKIFISTYDIVINNIFLNDVLLKYVYIDSCDNKAYIKRSISGILENRILLDYIISKYSKTKLNKLDKKVYVVLLCAIYELLFMDSAKKYAVINEYVDIIKKQKTQFHANFVNAILRNVSQKESKDRIFKDTSIGNDIKYSIPKELYNYLIDHINIGNDNVDDKITEIFKYYKDVKHISFRLNTLDENDISDIIKEFHDKNIECYFYDKTLKLNKLKCLFAKNIVDLITIDSFNKGLISVQDISSIYYIDKLYDLIKELLPTDIKVLDSCASPGGKSMAFLKVFDDHNIDLYSCDKTDGKLIKLKQNFDISKEYIKYKSLNILVNDASKNYYSYNNYFDVVLLDVPCSGLGIISKKPDIKYNFDIKKIDDLITIQKSILDTNKSYVKLNGFLCYSTCTITKNENDDMINSFLKNNTNFKLIYKEQILSSVDNLSDGFYFSILKRQF